MIEKRKKAAKLKSKKTICKVYETSDVVFATKIAILGTMHNTKFRVMGTNPNMKQGWYAIVSQ